jgi:hypothetical protein
MGWRESEKNLESKQRPSLLFLNLVTAGGTSGRIVFPGNKGFRSLKYLSLCINYCGTSLEFEAGSMSKLEHVKLEFRAHEMECLHGPSTLGIQHLSSLHKVEIILRCKRHGYDGNYNPMEDDHDDTVRCISRAINATIETLPNRPTPRLETEACLVPLFSPNFTVQKENSPSHQNVGKCMEY